MPDVSCSTRVQERNSQSISTLPLRSSLSPRLLANRKKKVKNCVDLLQKEKILKVKVEFIFIQFTSDIKRQLHSPLPRPPLQDGTRPPLTRCPFFMKITFLHNSTGEGRKSDWAKAKRKSMKRNFSTSFRQSGIFYDAT